MTGTPDLRGEMKRAVMSALKHSADFTALISKASIYFGSVPADRPWPFARFGSIIGSPFAASGLDSSSFRFSVQAFTKGVKAGSIITLPPEDDADRIGSAFKVALDNAVIDIGGGMKLRIAWVQTITLRDGDDDAAWMVNSTFRGEVAG